MDAGTGKPKWVDPRVDVNDTLVGNHCIGTGSSINIKGTDVPECNATTANTLQDNRYYVDTVTKPTPVCPPGVALERGSETLPLPSNDAIMKLARAALDM